MLIRCKIAPYTWAWSEPKRRFIFSDTTWRPIDAYGISVLRSKLKTKFNDCFDLKNDAQSLDNRTVEKKEGIKFKSFKRSK